MTARLPGDLRALGPSPAAAEPLLAVVIPTRDRHEALAHTLSRLDAQRCPPDDVEVVVVDNGSSDGTLSWLQRREGRLPLHVLREMRPGPAAARNRGVERATAPVILFLGDDTAPATDDVLAGHLRLHREDPRPDMAVLAHVTWRPDRPASDFMRWLERGGPQFDFGSVAAGPVSPARHFYTSHVSVKRAALQHVGGFDERFVHAAVEDIELGLRLERAGLTLHYHPELAVHHDHLQSPRDLPGRQEKVGAAARLMRELHGDHGLMPAPRWSWPVHRAARPALAALACRPLPTRAREAVWTALALAGYARGWSRSRPADHAGAAPVPPSSG